MKIYLLILVALAISANASRGRNGGNFGRHNGNNNFNGPNNGYFRGQSHGRGRRNDHFRPTRRYDDYFRPTRRNEDYFPPTRRNEDFFPPTRRNEDFFTPTRRNEDYFTPTRRNEDYYTQTRQPCILTGPTTNDCRCIPGAIQIGTVCSCPPITTILKTIDTLSYCKCIATCPLVNYVPDAANNCVCVCGITSCFFPATLVNSVAGCLCA